MDRAGGAGIEFIGGPVFPFMTSPRSYSAAKEELTRRGIEKRLTGDKSTEVTGFDSSHIGHRRYSRNERRATP
jgi:hypothetical protein